MNSLISIPLRSVLVLLLFFAVYEYTASAQSKPYQISMDTLATYQPLHAVKFTYGRFGGNETPSIFMQSIPFFAVNGDPGFFTYTKTATSWQAAELKTGSFNSNYHHYVFDFDRDGFDDVVVVADDMVVLLRNKGQNANMELEPPVRLYEEFEDDVNRLLIRDLNNDGYEDLVADNYTWIGINNRGKSLLSYYPPKKHSNSYSPFTIFDANKDGWQDIYFYNSGSDGTRFLTKKGIFDLSNPKVIPEYPRNIIPVNYDPDIKQEVIALNADLDRSEQQVSFRLDFYSIAENFDFTFNHSLGVGPFRFNVENVNAYVHKTAIPDSNGADIIFSYSLAPDKRIKHFLKVTADDAEISTTDTVSYIEPLPYTIMDGEYVTPASNALEWLGNAPVSAMVKKISGLDIEATPGVPQNITTDISDNLLTISWDQPPTGNTDNMSYSVYMTNEETGFQYRSDYLVPFRNYYDHTQNRVFNNFKLFKDLPSGTYEIRVQSVDKFSRRSEKSAPVSVDIDNNEQPEVPDSLNAQAVDAGIEISFNMTSYFDSVRVYRSESETFDDYKYIGKAHVHRQNFIDENVHPASTYTYALKAFLNGEASEFTEKNTVKTAELNISNIFSPDNPLDTFEDVISYDLNLDGYKDLIINSQRSDNGKYNVYLIPGTEQGYDKYDIKVLLEAELILQLRVGDWDGDLQPDLIHQVINHDNWTRPTKVHLLKDLEVSETITFDAGKNFDTVNAPYLLFSADLDLNGRLDLVYGEFDHLIVAWNDETGVTPEAITTNGFNTYAAKKIDLNQDGFEDLIVDEGPGSSPVIYVNQKERSFERTTVGLPIYSGNSEAGAYIEYRPILFNDDMYPDLLVATEIALRTDTMGVVHTRPVNKIFEFKPETERYEESDFKLDTVTTWELHRPIHFNNDEYVDFLAIVDNELKILVNEANEKISRHNIQLSSISWLEDVLQADTDHDGDQDIMFFGHNSPTIFQIENQHEPVVSIPNTPLISEITGSESGIAIKWEASHWNSNLDAQTGYGVRISSEERNILVGNIHPITGKRSAVSMYSAFQNTHLEIPELPAGDYSVWVSAYNPLDKSSGFSEVEQFTILDTSVEWEGTTELSYRLDQNYPNPFNPVTAIRYQIPKATKVTLQVFDVMGRLIKTLVDESQNAGNYQATFDGTDIASGVYIYRLKTDQKVLTKKLTLIK